MDFIHSVHAPSLIESFCKRLKKALEATVSRMFFVFHFLTVYYYFLHFNNTWSIFIVPSEHNYGETIIRCCLFCIQFECLWQKVHYPHGHAAV